MKKIKLLTFFIISILFLILIPQITFSESGRRTALVIGNGGYKFSALRNSVNDATDMASALKNLGFKVTLKTNADQKTMERAIRNFGKTLQNGGVGLFYYAGHGIQINGRNYLIPIGAVIETESDAEFEAVDASRVLGKMEDAGNKINILILDACRNNPYGSQFRSVKRGLAIIPAPQGTIVAYATAPGDIANDGEGRNGLYTSMLLKHISAPDLTIERFFKVVGRDVRSASNNNQIPWIQSSLVDDFFFNDTKTERYSIASQKQNFNKPSIYQQKHVESQNISKKDAIRILILEKEVSTNPKNVKTLIQLANKYFDTNQPLKAIVAYEKSLELDPKNADVLCDLGTMYRRTGQLQKAIKFFDEAIKINPQNEPSRYNKGFVLLYDFDDFNGALKVWEELVKINPLAKAPNGIYIKDMIDRLKLLYK